MRILEEVQSAADEARARGMMYAMMAWSWRYPERETVSALRTMLGRCLTPSAINYFDSNTTSALKLATSALIHESRDVLRLETNYSLLFGHAVRGSCPLYELEYGQAEIVQQAGELADIAGFYGAFGLESTQGSMERVDHVAVECEFMSVLCAKQATGVLSNNSDLVDACYEAQRTFLRDHLARWLPALAAKVVKADYDGIYGHLARVSSAFLASECRALGITPGPDYLELRRVDPNADTEIQCGPAPAEQLVPLTMGGLNSASGA